MKISGGSSSEVINSGSISGADGPNTWAVVSSGNTVVNNYGSIAGQINLGKGKNAINNYSGAIFAAGPQILLGGPKNTFTNNGALMFGNSYQTEHTYLDGSFVQTATGTTYTKLNFRDNSIDRLSISGKATLAGQLDLLLLNPQLIPFGKLLAARHRCLPGHQP